MDPKSFNELSSRQRGVFARSQVESLGATDAAIRHELGVGRWREELPSVYGLAGHHDGWRRRLWIAHLHAGDGTAIGMDSAGRIHGYPQAWRGTLDVVVASMQSRPPVGVRWFRRADLLPKDIVDLEGLPPLTSPARTVVDLAGRTHVATLRLMVEHGLVERHYRTVDLAVLLDRVRRSGKNGVRRLAQVLDDLGPGEGVSRSELERLGDSVITASGLPSPEREHPLPSARGRKGFVDRCWPEAKLIVELDGRKWHHRFQQALADADRRLEAQALGWQTSALLWEHCDSDADRTAEVLRTIYDERARLLA